MVVPHHGANLNGGAAAPKPFRGVNEYCRLLYSFGHDNAHGATGVRHPTLNTATLNIGAGWDHGAWHLPTPADKVAGATGANLGGILVGLNGLPAIFKSPCGGGISIQCTTTPGLS